MDWLPPSIVPGFGTLFLVSFLAATLLPLGSEWLLAALLVQGFHPVTTVLIATAGNLGGALTTWLIGRQGGEFLLRRVLRIDAAAEARAERCYARYGCWSLLLSWVPILGDPLCLVAGVLRVDGLRFVLLVGAGKLARYALVAWLTLQSLGRG